METISNVVQKATTAIWGEDDTSHQLQAVDTHGDEPMSGVQGKGAVDDPFDAGNREDQSDNADSIDEPTPTVDSSAAKKTTTEPSPTDNLVSTTTGQPMSSSTEASGGNGGGSSSTAEKQSTGGAEQRSAEKPDASKPDASSSHPPSAMDDPNLKISEEALKGPQGPAPHSASEFEKDVNKAPSGKADASGDAPKAGGATEGKDTTQKHGTMSRMKERLNKVTHLHHSSK